LSKAITKSSPFTLDEELVHALVLLAEAAGQEILSFYGQKAAVWEKGDSSPLTAADLASHQIIQRGLKGLASHVPLLSEESAPMDDAERLSWSTYWLVDPLDGTKEFLNRNGEFTVNIALIENQYPCFGIVHVPVHGLTYVGQGGKGAFRMDANHIKTSLSVAEIASDPLRVLGSRSHPAPDLDAYLVQQGSIVMEPVGSSLKFCRVAEGTADLYPRFGPTSEWDTAAGQAVLEAAGGRVVDLQGRRLRYNHKVSLLNPFFLAFGDLGRNWLPCQEGY
jgi:3'(2'), 5'-bisphosphate nucleotidase